MSKRKAKKRYEQQKLLALQNNESLCWWLLLAILLLVPLLLGLAQFEFYSPTLIGSVNDSGEKAEVFVTYKWYCLMALSVLLLAAYCWRLLRLEKTIRPSYANLPLLALTVLLLLSLLFAEYKQIALFGMHDMREGASTWLCYLLLFFVAAQSALPLKLEKALLIVLGVLVSVNAVMGVLLFYGINIMDNSFIANLIMLGQAEQFSSSGEIFGTMTNPNYLSPLGSCLGIFFAVCCMLSRRPLKAILTGAAVILSFSIIITSLSASGFVSFVGTLVIALPLTFLLSRQKIRTAVRAGALAVLCIALMVTYGSHNPNIYQENLNYFTRLVAAAETSLSPPVALAEPIAEDLAPAPETKAEPNQLSDTITDPELLPVEAIATFGSNRGYIWTETLRMTMDRPLLGHGLDTMAFYFPYGTQDHYAHRGNTNEVVSKPHNMYLGVGFYLGLPALLALLILLALIMWKERPWAAGDNALAAALWCAMICFLVQFLVNDSSLGTSVPFWIMLGLLVSQGRKTPVS